MGVAPGKDVVRQRMHSRNKTDSVAQQREPPAMTEHAPTSPMSPSAIRPDAADRALTVVRAEEARHPHVAIAGDTYTILVTGADTGGQYCLVDMYVPPGGGPPPHRHDFEEMFRILEGEIEVTFRGETATLRAR